MTSFAIFGFTALVGFMISLLMRGQKRFVPLAAAIAVTALAIASPFLAHSSPPLITVVNRSTQVLKDVRVHNFGDDGQLGQIEPGSSRIIVPTSIPADGNSRLKFEINGSQVGESKNQSHYIESRGGYRVRYIVNPDLSVTVRSSFMSHPNWRYYMHVLRKT